MDRLVQKGVAARWANPEERRSVVAGLSAEGAALADSLLRLRRSRWEERLAFVDRADLELMAKALDRLVRGLARVSDATPPETAALQMPVVAEASS